MHTSKRIVTAGMHAISKWARIMALVMILFLTTAAAEERRQEDESMANYREDIVSIDLMCGNIHRSFKTCTIGEGDEKADRFGVRVFKNGQPETLSGSCIGKFIRADGLTVPITTGSVDGNLAYVDLPEDCYAVAGVFSLAIKVTASGNTTTLRIVDGNVAKTDTNIYADPGVIMPTIESLLAEIENAVASIPAAGFANGSALNPNIFNVGDYENGAIKQATGENESSTARIRSKLYIPTTAKKFYSSNSAIRFMLYAYDKLGQYVGAFQSNGTLGTNAGSFSEIDMSQFYINPSYEGYKYRIVIRSTSGNVQVDNVSGIYIDSYIVNVPQNIIEIAENKSNIQKLYGVTAGENVSRVEDINSSVLWEIGGISYVTGENAASSVRGRTRKYIPTNVIGISFGTYSSTRGFYLYAYEADGTYVGAYKKSTGTFVTDGSETGFNTEYKYFDIGYFFRTYPMYRFRIQVYARNSGSDVTAAEFQSWILINGLIDGGKAVKVIQYNIGKFNYGVAGGLASNVSEKISNYREFFANANADFLCMQEYVEYIDSGESYAADATLFNPIFFDKSYSERETVIFGQHKMYDTRFTYLHTPGDNPAQIIFGETVIAGKTVAIVSGYLNSSAPEGIDHEEQGIRALTKLTDDVLANYDYAIVCMDCNCISQEEASDFLAFMKGKGYRSGNWDYLGYKDTYNLSSSMYHAIDNVFVKGNMRIVNFEVPDVYADLSSDHFPVIAEIRMK